MWGYVPGLCCFYTALANHLANFVDEAKRSILGATPLHEANLADVLVVDLEAKDVLATSVLHGHHFFGRQLTSKERQRFSFSCTCLEYKGVGVKLN